MDASELIREVESEHPLAVRLAETVSLAVLVDPPLLRRARLKLVPEADPGTEADLWNSALVQTSSPDGFVLIPEVAHGLRERLRDSGRLGEVWELTRYVHGHLSPVLKLEEEIAYRSVSPDSEKQIETLLRSVLSALVIGDRRGLAHWAARALPRFPAGMRETEAARILDVGVRLHLGGDARALQEETEDLAWIVPADLPRVPVRVRLLEGAVELDAGSTGGMMLQVPKTDPLLVGLSWSESGVVKAAQAVFRNGEKRSVSAWANAVQLRTLLGEVHELRAVQELARGRDPSMPASPPTAPHGLGTLRTYGEGFAGRKKELEALDQAWEEGVRIFVLHAQGGAGKTRVVVQWLSQMSADGWRGAGRVFVHSFYCGGSDERRNASSETFFEAALAYFGHTGPALTDPQEKGRTLARLVAEQRGLLVLDGLESLQQPPAFDQGRLKDPALSALLSTLAAVWQGEAGPAGGLCLVTSRQPVVELESKAGRVVVQQPLDRLDPEAGAELLRQLEVAGPEKELRQASEELRGHAYTLMLLGTYLRDATPDHEIRRRAEIPLLQEDAEHNHHARHLFAAYVHHLGEASPEVAVLRLLGFFDRPAEEKLVTALREADDPELAPLLAPLRNLPDPAWRRVLRRLSGLRLIDVPAGSSPVLDAHPLLRETFAEQVRTDFPAAWQAGHRRLFEVLCATTEHRPDTLPGLQPLYQAVAHGCRAGLYEQARAEVYRDRILRGTGDDGFYSTRKLGAIGADLGAVACFFTTPWTTLAPSLAPAAQAWLLNQAASRLRALGRLTEAVEPMRAGMEMAADQGDWKNAAIYSGNLSELELTRGEVAAAVASGEQSVTFADRSGDAFLQLAFRTMHADALHQAGRRAEARGLFEDAEARQAERQPEYPRLYSLWGFLYCDLLLVEAERAAWQRWLREGGLGETLAAVVADCAAVGERVTDSLKIAEYNRWLLDIALNHLTLVRATLYKADFANPIPAAQSHITSAVEGIRAAGEVSRLPHGLLTRAWLRCASGDEPGARADLEEAWEIAERGPMPLFQADVLLTRARLFRDRGALAEARRLMERLGYHRRDKELADAEEAAGAWDLTRPPLPSPPPAPGEGAPPP